MGGSSLGCTPARSSVSPLDFAWWSRRFSFVQIDDGIVKEIDVGIVDVEFDDFGDDPASRPAFDVDHDIQRVADVGFDGAIWQVNVALQNAARKASQALPCGSGVNS